MPSWVSMVFTRTFSKYSEFFLFASQNCLHTCFCICGQQICTSSGLWVPVRCSVNQGAQSSMKMLFSAWWPPPESEGSREDESISGVAASHLDGGLRSVSSHHWRLADWLGGWPMFTKVWQQNVASSTLFCFGLTESLTVSRKACLVAPKEKV